MTKRCKRCSVVKSLTEFYAHSGMADGHLNQCKACVREQNRKKTDEQREHRRQYDRARAANPERKKKAIIYQARSRVRHPVNYAARTAVSNAARTGKIERKPCEVCKALVAQAHHTDYTKPLDVKWFCFRCHRVLAHRQRVDRS